MAQMKILCSLLAVMVTVSLGATSTTRPSYFGLSLAYPYGVPELVTESKLPYFLIERLVTVVLDIDKTGRVTDATAANLSDSAFVRYARPWLSSIEYEPATFRGEKVPSRLPVILQFRPRVRFPDLHFPIDSTPTVGDADLYFDAVALNNIRPPQLKEFPSYFCDLKWSDTSVIFKYVLAKIALDESGRVTDVREVSSTYPAFTQQIMSAILWASFSPAVVDEKAVPSECFVLVSFFPQISYPVPVWRQSDFDSLAVLKKFRVRLLPDTVGLMSKPLPAKLPGDQFTLAGRHALFRSTVSAALSIDTAGHIAVQRMSKAGKEMQTAIRKLAGQLRFFPALDYDGHPRRFSGLASFIFQASSNIRVLYHWLPSDKSNTQR